MISLRQGAAPSAGGRGRVTPVRRSGCRPPLMGGMGLPAKQARRMDPSPYLARMGVHGCVQPGQPVVPMPVKYVVLPGAALGQPAHLYPQLPQQGSPRPTALPAPSRPPARSPPSRR